VKELAEKCTFLEVCYLLLYGELPSKKELGKFEETVIDEMCIHESMINFYKSFEKDSHPMAIMVSMVGAMSAFMKETDYAKDEYQR
jgi:citrate synthase